MADKSVYTKIIDEKKDSGELKKQYTLDLSPWAFEADEKKGTKAMSGYTCKIGVQKLGTNSSYRFINIDPSSKELRNALSEMYAEYDKTVGNKQ